MTWVNDYYGAYVDQQLKWMKAHEDTTEQLREVWSRDAAAAWDDGRAFYQPILISQGSRQLPSRDEDTEVAMEAITAAGWQLHTWSIATHALSMGAAMIVTAHPLFIRPRT